MASTGLVPSNLVAATDVILYQSAATINASTVTSDARSVADYTNAEFTVNATAFGTGTLNVYIQKQLSSGDWTDIISFTQLTGTGKRWIHYFPTGMTADVAIQDAALTAASVVGSGLGDTIRVKSVLTGAGAAVTFTVTATFYS